MSLESNILGIMVNDRSAWEAATDLDVEDDLSSLGKVIYDNASEYYDRDPTAKFVDRNLLLATLKRKYPKAQHFDQYKKLVEGLTLESVPNVLEEIRQAKLEVMADKVAKCMFDRDFDKAEGLLETFTSLQEGKVEDLEGVLRVGADIASEDDTGSMDRFMIRPKALNMILNGNLRRKHHVVVFARSDTGKTLFLINAAVGFILQNYKVLYILNEEPITTLVARVKANFCNVTIGEMEQDEEAYTEALTAKGYFERFISYEVDEGYVRDIEKAIKQVKPDVVILDQLRNVNTKDDSKVAAYENLGRSMRKFARKYDLLAMSATQAGAQCEQEDRAKLGMTDIDGSKTGLAASCDLIIGMGASEQMKVQNQVLINLAKNKVSGVHDGVMVRIDPQRSKIK